MSVLNDPLVTEGTKLEGIFNKVLCKIGLTDDDLKQVEQFEEFFEFELTEGLMKMRDNTWGKDRICENKLYVADIKLESSVDQQKILNEHFYQSEDQDEQCETRVLPESSNGVLVIPNWINMGLTYKQALRLILSILDEVHGGRFYSELECKYIILRKHTERRLRQISKSQNGRFLSLPVSFIRNLSGRQTLATLAANEFGLDIFSVLCLLLTHPHLERQVKNHMILGCIGSMYTGNTYRPYSFIPIIDIRTDQMRIVKSMDDENVVQVISCIS